MRDERQPRAVLVFKVAVIIVLAVFIAVLMHDPVAVDVPLDSVEKKIEVFKADKEDIHMVSSGDMRVKRSFGLNTKDYKDVLYYEPETNMDVDEILIIHVKDSSQLEGITTAMEKRIAVQKENFDGYGTDQLDTLKSALIYSNDGYACLVISKHSREMLKLIRSMVEA